MREKRRRTAANPPSSFSNSLTNLALHHSPNCSSFSAPASSPSFSTFFPLSSVVVDIGSRKSLSPGTNPASIGPCLSARSRGNGFAPRGILAGLKGAGEGEREGYGRRVVVVGVGVVVAVLGLRELGLMRAFLPRRFTFSSSELDSSDELDAAEEEEASSWCDEGMSFVGGKTCSSSLEEESPWEEADETEAWRLRCRLRGAIVVARGRSAVQ